MALTTLSRAQFNQACESFIHKQLSLPDVNEFTARCMQGWHWEQHLTVPGLGYMSRLGSAFRNSHGLISSVSPDDEFAEDLSVDDDDASTLPPQAVPRDLLTVHQYIVYSPTFQVPAFYFTIHDINGSPLPLKDIVQSTLFHTHVLPESAHTAPHGILMPASNFPLLSQGDHPVTGSPCWYFHPCETSAAVTELMNEAGPQNELTTDQQLLRWMEAWYLVLCGVVDLR